MSAQQMSLTGLDLPPNDLTQAGTRRRAPLTVAEISRWGRRQVSWIARRAHLDRRSDLFMYMQAAKLVEEVGELNAQLLGRNQQQRPDKIALYTPDTLAGEFADVVICVAILADVAGVDLSDAVRAKMQTVDNRFECSD